MLDIKKEELKESIVDYLKILFRKSVEEANDQQLFQAVSYAIKDIIVDQWIATHKEYEKQDAKTVYYLSMEFLMGRALGNNIINMGAHKVVKEVLDELGLDLNVIEDQEPDPALGNGGLGRLQHVFLIHYQHLATQHMVVELDINTVCLSKKLRMDSKLKFQIIG